MVAVLKNKVIGKKKKKKNDWLDWDQSANTTLLVDDLHLQLQCASVDMSFGRKKSLSSS